MIGRIYYQPRTNQIILVSDILGAIYLCEIGGKKNESLLVMFPHSFARDGWELIGRI